MKFLKFIAPALSLLFASSVHAAALVPRAQVIPIIPFSTIVEPSAGTAVAAGQTFDLNIPVSVFGECPSSLYSMTLYLLDHVPTDADVNPNLPGPDPTILSPLYHFGNGSFLGWTEPNVPPPNIPTLPPLPASLTMPDLGIADSEIYFVVTEYLDTCPGHGAIIRVGVSYNAIEYSS